MTPTDKIVAAASFLAACAAVYMAYDAHRANVAARASAGMVSDYYYKLDTMMTEASLARRLEDG